MKIFKKKKKYKVNERPFGVIATYSIKEDINDDRERSIKNSLTRTVLKRARKYVKYDKIVHNDGSVEFTATLTVWPDYEK